jgi:hypothetical protein
MRNQEKNLAMRTKDFALKIIRLSARLKRSKEKLS